MKCEYCKKDFKRLDLHDCKLKPKLSNISNDTNLETETEIQIPSSMAQNWAYYGMSYILGYLWTTENVPYVKFYKLKNCKPEVFLDDIEEGFVLTKPALISEGTPIFLVRRGFPISITLEMVSIKEMNELRILLKENKMTSTEFYSWVKSGYTSQILKISRIGNKESMVLLIAFVIISCLITFIITSSYYMNLPTDTLTNNTIGGL